MGATQYAQIPWPEPTAPVRQGAAAMRALAEAIDPRWSGATLVRRATMNVANNSPVAFAWSGAANTPNVGGSVPSTTDGITIGQAGIYVCHVAVHWDANATGSRSVVFLGNGTANLADEVADVRPAAPASMRTVNDSHRTFRLNAGDKINAQVTQTSGITLGVLWARLEVYRIA